ncbi:MAG: type II toxin-antitoxin system RelE/ParE family toxin [Curvibacter sp.]|nr:MAG: type II toxin-antitoxin system RelE/ParE family toxin [Curvibacter sp.]
MLPVLWSDEASLDLVEIIDFIEQPNTLAAHRLLTDIIAAAEQLAHMPELFRPGRVSGTRECVVHPNYVLVYRVGVSSVDLLRVLHARQKYP